VKLTVDLISNKKNYKINDSRTIGISKNNVDFFNSNIINIEKLIWNIKTIEIFSENLKREKLINFKKKRINCFQLLKIINFINY
jgi:2-octaprenyl-6-methoxyphenol hydroxylase